MRSSAEANRPRWRGEAGFFEIWFLVVFAPAARRAWWLRYTTFAPAAGRGGPTRTTLWAAAFDAARPAAVAVKRIAPIDAYDAGPRDAFRIRIGDAELANGVCRGAVAAGGHVIAWDLAFTPAAHEARRMPRLLEHVPLPTHVAHANADVACSGRVTVDGVTTDLDAAPAVQKHLWGTRRVEELFWLYGAHFDRDATARIEATAVRATRRLGGGPELPRLATVWLRAADGDVDACGLAAVARNRLTVVGPARVELRSRSATHDVRATAWCDPETLAGWVYRDPQGWDVHVAQSDVASCTVDVRRRPHPLAPWGAARRLECREAAALELHAPEPLPGVRYVPWDATA